jgi:electron transfer flavoprotein beta subunit
VEIVELKMPCVLTITKGAYEPRYASLKGIMAAKKKPLEEKGAEVGAAGVSTAGLEYPAERQAGRIVGEGPDAVPELLRILREEAKVI